MTRDASPYPTPTVRRKSLSDLVHFEDLSLLDGGDLRAVLNQVPDLQVVQALIGVTSGLRHRLLTKLPSGSATDLAARIDSLGPVPFETIQVAQRAVVDTLCRLSRGGFIAFDDPADMMVA